MKLALSLTGRGWRIRPASEHRVRKLASALGVSPLTARALVLRGLTDPIEATVFWRGGDEALHDPMDTTRGLAGLAEAVDGIWRAIQAGQKITVYGDYDVDGVSSTALMVEVLSSLGAVVDHYIPGRLDEGYGLNAAALEEIRGRGTRLVVTVDCGVSAIEEARRAHELGLNLIITDHHRPGEELPECLAVVNPRRADCPYPFKDLAGVGVAYKVAQGLLARASGPEADGPGSPRGGIPEATSYLDLVALGTIGDVVPLLGENRYLVKRGLELLSAFARPGIAALCTVSGYEPGRGAGKAVGTGGSGAAAGRGGAGGGGIEAGQVAFGLAPRLNAAGRMGTAQTALDLLLSRRKGEAAALASQLDAWNRERQSTEQRILTEALSMTGAPEAYTRPAVVLAARGWHPGVIGIVASKLTEVFHRPVFLIALDGEQEEGRGSARSVPWCDLYTVLAGAADILVRFGGHHQAAGFTVLEQNIGEFTRRIEEACAAVAAVEGATPGQASAEADGWLAAADLEEKVIKEIQNLAPFGYGNPSPVFLAGPFQVVRVSSLGQSGQHLRIDVSDTGGRRLETVAFGLGQYQGALKNCADGVYLAVNPEIDSWQGRERLRLVVRDITPAGAPVALTGASAGGERWTAGETLAGQAAAAIVAEAGSGFGDVPALDRVAIMDARRGRNAGQVAALRRQSGGMPGDESARARTVLHLHPGFSLADLCARSAWAEEVWLAFDEDDAATNEVFLAAVCPDRDFLVRLYRVLREKNRGQTQLAPGDILAGLEAMTPVAAPASGAAPTLVIRVAAKARVEVGLQVLRDLGLLQNGSLRLAPSPPGKLDLEASRTFRAAHDLVRQYRNYASFVLEAAPEEVRQALVEVSVGIAGPGKVASAVAGGSPSGPRGATGRGTGQGTGRGQV